MQLSARGFTKSDYPCLEPALKVLTDREFEIVVMRYWENLPIWHIARLLRADWSMVDRRLSKALMKLKVACLTNPSFSRHAAVR